MCWRHIPPQDPYNGAARTPQRKKSTLRHIADLWIANAWCTPWAVGIRLTHLGDSSPQTISGVSFLFE
jgi:hypothetical protein